jgi:hypothetical protein
MAPSDIPCYISVPFTIINVGILIILYFLGSFINFKYNESHDLYNTTYNVTTGCPILKLDCNMSAKINCYQPFYKNCAIGGLVTLAIVGVSLYVIIACCVLIWPPYIDKKEEEINEKNDMENDLLVIRNNIENNLLMLETEGLFLMDMEDGFSVINSEE